MHRGRSVNSVLDELVAAIDQRETGDPDAGDWSIAVRIRRLERDLADAWRSEPGRRRAAESEERTRPEDAAALAGIV